MCVVLFEELLKESLHGNYYPTSYWGGSDPCLNLKPDPILVYPSPFLTIRESDALNSCSVLPSMIGCSDDLIRNPMIGCMYLRSDDQMIGS